MIRVELRLFAGLMDYLPAGADRHGVSLELETGSTIGDVIDHVKIPRRRAHLVVCNGTIVRLQQIDTHQLEEGDRLAVWPPVAGG